MSPRNRSKAVNDLAMFELSLLETAKQNLAYEERKKTQLN